MAYKKSYSKNSDMQMRSVLFVGVLMAIAGFGGYQVALQGGSVLGKTSTQPVPAASNTWTSATGDPVTSRAVKVQQSGGKTTATVNTVDWTTNVSSGGSVRPNIRGTLGVLSFTVPGGIGKATEVVSTKVLETTSDFIVSSSLGNAEKASTKLDIVDNTDVSHVSVTREKTGADENLVCMGKGSEVSRITLPRTLSGDPMSRIVCLGGQCGCSYKLANTNKWVGMGSPTAVDVSATVNVKAKVKVENRSDQPVSNVYVTDPVVKKF